MTDIPKGSPADLARFVDRGPGWSLFDWLFGPREEEPGYDRFICGTRGAIRDRGTER